MGTIVQTKGKRNPDFKHLLFDLNPETGYFEMIRGEMGFQKVPAELKLEETQKKGLIKSDYLIRGRIRNGKYLFFTGIIQTDFNTWYFGDFFEIKHGIKRNSFILFHFSTDLVRFEMFFFNHFKLYPEQRAQFIRNFVNSQKK
jgi:hypothetical protein